MSWYVLLVVVVLNAASQCAAEGGRGLRVADRERSHGHPQRERGLADDAAPYALMKEGYSRRPLFTFTVLVTGFEPFGDYAINPSLEVAQALNGTCHTVYLRSPHAFLLCYESMALPVNSAGSSKVAAALEHDPYQWDGVLHMGFESEAKGLRLETIAANVKATEEWGHMWNADIPCDKTGTPHEDIHHGAPCVLPTTAPISYLNLNDVGKMLELAGLGQLVTKETWSRDAGAYYCNDIYYRTLYAIRSNARAAVLPALFIHLPQHDAVKPQNMVTMVQYVVESMMVGTIGLLP